MIGNQYPIIEFNKQLWEEILPIITEWGCDIDTSNDINKSKRIVSNYGDTEGDYLKIGYTHNTSEEGRRYLVKTKEEFLSAIAKLAGKVYPSNTSIGSITLKKSNKLHLNFRL